MKWRHYLNLYFPLALSSSCFDRLSMSEAIPLALSLSKGGSTGSPRTVKFLCSYLALLSLSISVAYGEEMDIHAAAGTPQASFDDIRYRLGYDVYLANKNLAAAWQVADKAISAEPTSLFWLERYAQISEWVGKPSEALGAWLKLAKNTNDNNAWNAVGRLAESLLDDEALLQYQRRLLALNPNNEAAILKLVQIYERLGRPDDGLAFLAQLNKSNAKKTLLIAEAGLAERAGKDERAITALNRLIQHYPPVEESWLLRRAALFYQRGDIVQAWQSLTEVEKKMPTNRGDYWRTYAELSRLIDKKDTAERAYQHLTDEFLFSDADLMNYSTLQIDSDPLNAAFLNELSFRLYSQDNAAIGVLFLYQKAHHLDGATQFLASLTDKELAKLEKNALFLEQRAQLFWAQKNLVAAQADYEKALLLAPKLSRLLQGLVGVLSEAHKNTELKTLLFAADSTAKRTPALWPTWGSAWLYLQQPLRALPFQNAYLRYHPNDALAAFSFADSLQNLGAVDPANNIRANLFQQQAALKSSETGDRLTELEHLFLSLSLDNMGSDASQQRLQQHLNSQAAQRPNSFSQALTLGWLLNHEFYDTSRQWLHQHQRQLAAPTWATLNLALQAQDQQTIHQLLNTQVAELPIYDRIEAATRVNRFSLAENLAFDTQEDYPLDDELHRRYSNLLSERGHWFDVSFSSGKLGALSRQQRQLTWTTPLTEHWRMALDLHQNTQKTKDVTVLGIPPKQSDALNVSFTHHLEQSDWTIAIHKADSLAAYTGWRVAQRYKFDSQLAANWLWSQHQESTDSTGLLVSGMKNRLAASINWTPTGREYVNAELAMDNYLSQNGQALGDGTILTVDAGHRLFSEQPDHVLKMNISIGQFTANNSLDPALISLVPIGQTATTAFFIPKDYQQIALAWAFGQVDERQYQRAWRVFGEVGVSQSDSNGTGINGQLGVHGSVIGGDRLSVYLVRSQGAQQNGDVSQQLHLSYRLFY